MRTRTARHRGFTRRALAPIVVISVVTAVVVALPAGSVFGELARSAVPSAGPSLDPAAGFHGSSPTRIIDTRNGTGTPAGPLASGETRTMKVVGVGGIPTTGVTAIVVTVTVVDGSAASHLTLWPADQSRPDVSNINWPAGDTRANLAIIPVAANGSVKAFNNSGSVHVLLDAVGWYDTTTVDAPGLRTVAPARIVDTRDGTGTASAPIGAGERRTLTATGRGGVPATGVTAIVANLTVTNGTAPSHLTAWPSDRPQPTASNVNWLAGDTRANLALLPVAPDGTVTAFNNSGTVDVVVDVVGWFDVPSALSDSPGTAVQTRGASGDAAAATPIVGLTTSSLFRAVDTRFGTGTNAARLTSGDIRTVRLTGQSGVPASGVSAVVANVTVTGGTAASHLTAWPADQPKPNASNLNWPTADTRASLAVIPVAPDGTADLFNNAGSVHVIVDVVGWFTGPTLDVRIDGVGTLAGDSPVRINARGFTTAPAAVELRIDDLSGPVVATATPSALPGNPLTAMLSTSGITNGSHVLLARAVDGSRVVVGTRVVTVDNQTYNWAGVTAGMQQKVDSIPLSGNALHVSHHGRTVYEQGFGTFTGQTQVFIASATKWMSGAVIMRLVDRGQLRLETRVSDVLPGFTGSKSGVTLRQLLSFTSGLAHDPPCSDDSATTIEACVAQIAALPMRAPAGTQYRYGSGHLEVAARMAEVVTGKSFRQLFADELTTPLGLTKTLFNNVNHTKPAGGAISNLDDYERFLRTMWNHGEIDGVRYLSTAAVDQMQRDQTRGAAMVGVPPGQGPQARYGLAEWFEILNPTTGGFEVSSPGAFGFLPWIDRERDTYGIYSVMLVNGPSAGGHDIRQRVRNTIDA